MERLTRFTTALSLLTLALVLTACAMSAPDRAPVHQPRVGVVESASVVSLSAAPSAAAGSTSSTPTMGYRLRMEDGSTQNILYAGERFEPGDRVELTSEGRLIRR
jgi:hypothetical protein